MKKLTLDELIEKYGECFDMEVRPHSLVIYKPEFMSFPLEKATYYEDDVAVSIEIKGVVNTSLFIASGKSHTALF